MIKSKASVASYMLKPCMDNIDSHSVAKNNLFTHNHACNRVCPISIAMVMRIRCGNICITDGHLDTNNNATTYLPAHVCTIILKCAHTQSLSMYTLQKLHMLMIMWVCNRCINVNPLDICLHLHKYTSFVAVRYNI